MGLSGNLKDFDISFIFQMVSQEGKTGKLILTNANDTGHVIFKNGSIINAAEKKKDMNRLLVHYLHKIKGISQEETRQLLSKFKDDSRGLCDELLRRNHLTIEEIQTIAVLGIEDFACSLFSWTEGSYSFEIHEFVNQYEIFNISIEAASLMMEAARRTDEFKLLKSSVGEQSVFIPAPNAWTDMAIEEDLFPIEDPRHYLLSLLDGTSSIEFICQSSFLSDYRVYEGFQRLLDENRITQLGDKLSKSINDALKRKAARRSQNTPTTVIASISVSSLIIAIFLISKFFIDGILLNDIITNMHTKKNTLIQQQNNNKYTVGEIFYKSYHIQSSPTKKDLIQEKILHPKDVKLVSSSHH